LLFIGNIFLFSCGRRLDVVDLEGADRLSQANRKAAHIVTCIGGQLPI